MKTPQEEHNTTNLKSKVDAENLKLLYTAELEALTSTKLEDWQEELKDAFTIAHDLWLLKTDETVRMRQPHLKCIRNNRRKSSPLCDTSYENQHSTQ